MTSIQTTNLTGAAPTNHSARAASVGNSELDYSAFMQLLIAQLQNQDPMEPMKSSDYVAQLATFSQVAKTAEMNAQMASLLTAVKFQQAEGIIGKTITSADEQVSGLVTGSKIVGNDVVAVLDDGREVTIGPGVQVSSGSTNGRISTEQSG